MSDGSWQIFALRYAQNTQRTRRDSFIMASDPDAPHPMDFFFWVLKNGDQVIVVDTGMDAAEGQRRGRPTSKQPTDLLRDGLGIDPAAVSTVIITHMHFDHAGCLDAFPNAHFHIQAEELAFTTGAMMGNPTLSMPYTPAHVTQMVNLVHDGRVTVHNGMARIAPGVIGWLVGGHAAGLMALTVQTARGRLVLTSDVAHYYESLTAQPIFHIVANPQQMVNGYQWVAEETGHDLSLVLPAHDPLIRQIYPETTPDIFELSAEPDHTHLPKWS